MLRPSILLLSSLVLSRATNAGPEFEAFKTEPFFRSVKINVTLNAESDSLYPGRIFITPFRTDEKYDPRYLGPHIFNADGTLVWYGNGTANNRAMNTHVCFLHDENAPHICYHDAPQEFSAYARGNIRFFDPSYTQAGQDYTAAGQLQAPDLHEVLTPTVDNGTTLLYTVYDLKSSDLTSFNGPADGAVLDGCFQEVDTATNALNFQWCALDHFDVWDTQVFLIDSGNYSTPIAGYGTLESPWDFFHINSVDKDNQGDYLVSARHLDAVLKIAGPHSLIADSGAVLWHLGGPHSTIAFETADAQFGRQHMARFVPALTNATHTTISLFDNSYDGWKPTAAMATGKIITISHESSTAHLVTTYASPDGLLSNSQGSMEVLPNGNVLIGWGFHPSFSEYAADGRLLYHAHFSATKVESYRAYKHHWVGRPRTRPKVLSYMRDCAASKLVGYVSWNGATEVTSWRFLTSLNSNEGPWKLATTIEKSGFETQAIIGDGLAKWTYVEALDSEGNILSQSDAAETFVPDEEAALSCDEFGCSEPAFFDYDAKFSVAEECKVVGKEEAAGNLPSSSNDSSVIVDVDGSKGEPVDTAAEVDALEEEKRPVEAADQQMESSQPAGYELLQFCKFLVVAGATVAVVVYVARVYMAGRRLRGHGGDYMQLTSRRGS